MRYLIDTNILFFLLDDVENLDRNVRVILNDYENMFYISAESVKEAIHIYQTKRMGLKRWKTAHDFFSAIEKEAGLIILPIKKEHLAVLSKLEKVDNHNDPNDRLIIAQAITEQIPLISSDRKFELYKKQQLDFIFNER